jgi:hypothetical protein
MKHYLWDPAELIGSYWIGCLVPQAMKVEMKVMRLRAAAAAAVKVAAAVKEMRMKLEAVELSWSIMREASWLQET